MKLIAGTRHDGAGLMTGKDRSLDNPIANDAHMCEGFSFKVLLALGLVLLGSWLD